MLPRVFRNWQRLEEARSLVSRDIGSSTGLAVADILGNVVLHVLPVISWA
jgi:hypothetical protein